MFNTIHQYDLSFVAPRRRPRTKPQIRLTIAAAQLNELRNRLFLLAESGASHAEAYCDRPVAFALPVPDLFGHTEFGYGKCGIVDYEDLDAHLSVELDAETLRECALTLNLLFIALSAPMETERAASNRRQQIDITTRCDHTALVYGHAISGYASPAVLAWIRHRAAETKPDVWGRIPAPPAIVRAMQMAWSAVVSPESRRWAKECVASLTPDGRFILECLGNACDVAIYPDDFRYGDEGEAAGFSCHNLDQARQQITLLAGLAKLCELARE